MARTQEGELELVLGNKQLLSVFFIVVVLLGVFFTMGYIVGRNSSEVAQTAAPGQPLVVEPSSPPATTASAAKPAPVKQPAPAPAAVKPVPAPPPSQAAANRTPTPAPPPSQPTLAVSGVENPAPGQVFLQVAATSRAEGRVLLDVLRERSFAGQLAPVPGQDLFRVLVGPLHGAKEIVNTRTRLHAAGFKPFLRKY